MAYQYETVDVRISRRTLWVGSQIYPLQSVARIRASEEVLDRGGLTWGFAKTVARTLGGGLAALLLVACTLPTRTEVQMVVLAGTVVVLVWQTYQFTKEVSRPNLYFLVIETAGAAHTAVVASPNRAVIADLADKVAEAIENPAVNYAVKIDVVQGDQFNQTGVNNTVSR